jgi:epoxyqueuosine reductase
VTTPDAIPEADAQLRAWLEAGFHGSMTWMDERVDERTHPASLWPDVKSIVMLGLSYAPDDDVLVDLQHKDRGTISAYARSRDYHDVIKSKLKRLARFIGARCLQAHHHGQHHLLGGQSA